MEGLAQAPFWQCTASDLSLLLLRQTLPCINDFASKLKSLQQPTFSDTQNEIQGKSKAFVDSFPREM